MQEVIKEILIYLQEKGLSEYVYFAFHLISFFAAVPFFIWLGKKMQIKPMRAFAALLIICIIFLALIDFIGWVEASLGLGNFGRKNAITVYVWIPLICIVAAKLTKVEVSKLCTLMAPTMPLIQTVSRPGCLFAGCCKGFEWQFGIYNINTKNFRFPMPIVEMLWMLAVAMLVLHLLKGQKYKVTARLYPLMLVVFGAVQFVSEFFIDNAKIWCGLSVRSFHELSMVVVGTIWLIILKNSSARKGAR